eukprot:TRINITY_DN5729_c0_g1_i1.p1 TRINITY_DN5729_c0_g1~~TRINITY_DN5729_c0_g1_i1.p1  ORF type:complete len:952 (-),score=237.23 TRINITY_DN5729_c0_g1_i1:87-2861(-)
MACGAQFTVTRRKHHCRACGLLFCKRCTLNSIMLPKEFRYGDELQRVCFTCFSRIRGITSDETSTAEIMLSSEESSAYNYRCIVEVLENGKRSEPVLIVAKYRLFFFRRPPAGSKKKQKLALTRNIHLYNIIELAAGDSANKMRLTFSDVKVKEGKRAITIVYTELPKLIHSIRSAYRAIMPKGLGDDRNAISIKFPEEMLLPVKPLEIGLAGGFSDTYRAQCNFLGVPVSQEILLYIEYIALRDKQNEFDMNDIPGIDKRSKIAWDMLPVTTVLFHNNYFKSVSLSNVDRRDAPAMISSIFSFNTTLTKLVLHNIPAEANDLTYLGTALKQNTKNVLQVIDLSECKLGIQVVENLASAIQSLVHGILALYLANCRMNSKQVTTLITEGFTKNFAASCALEELDLSGNRLDAEGSTAAENWMIEMGEYSHLRKLVLSNCHAFSGSVMHGAGKLPALLHVDLSQNIVDTPAAQGIVGAITTAPIASVSLAGCNIACEHAVSVTNYLVAKHVTAPEAVIRIDFSNNNMEDDTLELLAKGFMRSGAANLRELDLSQNQFSDKGLVSLFRSLKNPKQTLQVLRLANAAPKVAPEGEKEVLSTLLALLDETPSLVCLSLANGWPSDLVNSFLEALATNITLREIDVSYNRLGERGGRCVGQCVRWNKTLLLLIVDSARMSPSAWHNVACDIRCNTTLQWLPFPWNDYDRCIAAHSPATVVHLREHLTAIQDVCTRNRELAKVASVPIWQRHMSAPERQRMSTPQMVAPLVDVPKTLTARGASTTQAPAPTEAPTETETLTYTTGSPAPAPTEQPDQCDAEPADAEVVTSRADGQSSATNVDSVPAAPAAPPSLPQRNEPASAEKSSDEEDDGDDGCEEEGTPDDADVPTQGCTAAQQGSGQPTMGSILMDAIARRRVAMVNDDQDEAAE